MFREHAPPARLNVHAALLRQVSRGVTSIPAACTATVDKEYTAPSPFSGELALPLKVAGLPAALSQFGAPRSTPQDIAACVCWPRLSHGRAEPRI